MFLNSNKIYGLLILAVLGLTGLWLAYDEQAGIMQPGWFAEMQSAKFCRTVVSGSFGSGTFFHYPGKSLDRVIEDLGVPTRFRALYLDPANQLDTVCFDTWKETALADVQFQSVTKEYAEVLAGWKEDDYQQAVLMMNLQKGGTDRLMAILKLQQRTWEQSQQSK